MDWLVGSSFQVILLSGLLDVLINLLWGLLSIVKLHHVSLRAMEDWQQEFEWLRVRHWVKDRFDRKELPDLNAVLYLIGMQELGKRQEKFTKEEKQDLMHLAICHLLSEDGYFEFEGIDADGWPHWKPLLPLDIKGLHAQEQLLQQKVIAYFAPLLSNPENN